MGLHAPPSARTSRSLLVRCVLVVGMLGVVLTRSMASAVVYDSFDGRYQANLNGAITMIANTNLVCQASAACTTGLSSNTANNNGFYMVNSDADSDSATTLNSSSANLTLPAGAVVRFAGLYWGARGSAGDTVGGVAGVAAPAGISSVKFKTPSGSYTTVTAAAANLYQEGSGTRAYQGFVDVTSAVASAGSGTYWVGDIKAATGGDRYAGWSIVIAYELPSLPMRNLTVFDGLAGVSSSAGNTSVDIPLSGFLTPPFGTVNAQVGVVGYEGDRGTTGDQFKFNGTTMSDAANPASNAFNSSISQLGANVTTRSNPNVNTLGFDADIRDASGLLANSATSTVVNLTSSGDAYYPGVVTTQIDLYAPQFPAITKTAVDVNGGHLEPRGVTVSDVLPAGATFVSAEPTAGSCLDQAGTVSCDLGTVASGSEEQAVVVATVAAGFGATRLINSASVTASTGDPNAANNESEVSVPVVASADVSISKTVSPDPVVAGEEVTWTLTVRNDGPSVAQGVVVTDELPLGVTFDSLETSSGSCTAEGPTDGTVVTCALGALASGGEVRVTISGRVGADVPAGVLGNTATVVSATPDPDVTDNASSVGVTAERSADLAMVKTVSPAPVVAGEDVTWTLTVGNDGPSDARNVLVTDVLPAGVVFVSAESTAGSCAEVAGVVTCQVGTVAKGGSVTVTIVATVAAGFGGVELGNHASVTSMTGDPDPTDNVGSVIGAVETGADLAITKQVQGDVVAGEPTTFTIDVRNHGPATANGVTVMDLLAEGLNLVSVDSSLGSCDDAIGCNLGSLAAGASATITVVADVDPGFDGDRLSNTAVVGSSTVDPDATDNSATVTATVLRRADLAVSKEVDPTTVDDGAFAAGSEGAWLLTISNDGPSAARNVQLTDFLPEGVTFVSADVAGGECVTSADPAPAGSVACTVASIAPGEVLTGRVVVKVNADRAPGPIANTASVLSSTGDPDPTNNTATAGALSSASADLTITKRVAVAGGADPDGAVAGQRIGWVIEVSNGGPAVARGVTVTDVLPMGVEPTGPPEGCSAEGAVLTCSREVLGVGDRWEITVSGMVSPSFDGSVLANTASVLSATADAEPQDNASTAEAGVRLDVDLAVTKSVDRATASVGDELTWTVQVTNHGTSDASNVTVAENLPPGVTLVDASPVSAASLADGVWEVGSLPAGGSATVTLTARVEAAAAGSTLENVVTVTGPGDGGDGSDNRALAQTDVAPQSVDPKPTTTTTTTTTTATEPTTTSTTGPAATTLPPATRVPSQLALVDRLASTGAETIALVATGASLLAGGCVFLLRSRRRRR